MDKVVTTTLEAGDGGVIGVDRAGNACFAFNSLGLFRGGADSRGLYFVKIWE